VIFKKV